MRLHRVRFTMRTMMATVAVLALVLAFIIPAISRLMWLYYTPRSSQMFISGVTFRPIRSTKQDTSGLPRSPLFPVGQPVAAQCYYQCEPLPSVPKGIPFRVSVVSNLMNPPFTVIESQQESHLLISGLGSWKALQGTFSCRLTPRRAGSYMVQHEVNVTDVFGRKSRVALHTDGFEAR